jgi:glycosyltransferase involved in cell wall biosynthesis
LDIHNRFCFFLGNYLLPNQSSIAKDLPLISIIIACRNEEKFIGKCLDSIIHQVYPKDRLEVLVVDGESTDKTKDVVKKYVQVYPFIRLLENSRKVTPAAMNIGIKNSKGDVIILVNAHSILDKSFLENSIGSLNRTNADAVGGRLKAIHEGSSLMTKAIPLATDSIFGAGGKRYRSRLEEGFVKDTLPYCAYRREIIDRVGLIDEDLIRDQDEELNYRILKKGGKIYYSPQIKSYLFIRPSLKKLWKQHFQYGYFKPLVVKKVGGIMTWRQAIPSLFVSSILLTGILSFFTFYALACFLFILGLYVITNFFFSFVQSVKKKVKLIPFVSVSFATLHVSYGMGYIKGMFDFMIAKRHLRQRLDDLQITR